jgi:polyhydroxyalkanoate synthesis regulator phasin
MTEKIPAKPEVAIVVPPRRHPGHRGQDARDAVAEMAAKAAEISMEAGSKMAAAMKEVINAAAGLTGFAIESARDVVQFMVRRGQMTQDEADKLLHGVEEAYSKRHKGAKPAMPASAPAAKTAVSTHKPIAAAHASGTHKAAPKPAAKKAKPAKPAKPAKKPAPAKKAAAVKKAPAPKKATSAKKAPAAKKPAPKK